MVHTQLHHGHAVVCAQTQQGQWHTDVVVEVATGAQPHATWVMGLQDSGQHLRDRCLAIAADDRNERYIKLCTPCGCQLAQGRFGVSHLNAWHICGVAGRVCLCVANQRSCAFRLGVMKESVGVEMRTPQG